VTLAIIVGVIGVWQIATSTGLVSTFLLPSPAQIAASFPRLISQEGLLQRFGATAREVLVANLISVSLGGLAGWALSRNRTAWLAFNGWIATFNAAPFIMLFPLLLLIFGRGMLMIVVLGVLGGLPSIMVKSREAFATVPPVLTNVGRSLNLDAMRRFRLIELPAALPTLVAGMRLGSFYTLIAVIGGEFLTGVAGVGGLIPDLADRYALPGMYATIIFIITMSAIFLATIRRIERAVRVA
jgi:NitT/TauT family transport system permease protein